MSYISLLLILYTINIYSFYINLIIAIFQLVDELFISIYELSSIFVY